MDDNLSADNHIQQPIQLTVTYLDEIDETPQLWTEMNDKK